MDYKTAIKVITPYVDDYCRWAKRYEPYDFFRGGKNAALKTAMESVFKYFGNVRKPEDCYVCNDGSGDGGGFTGPVCDFGGMPCFMSFRFYHDAVLISIYKAEDHQGTQGPGLRLLAVHVGIDGVVKEVGFFENILK